MNKPKVCADKFNIFSVLFFNIWDPVKTGTSGLQLPISPFGPSHASHRDWEYCWNPWRSSADSDLRVRD